MIRQYNETGDDTKASPLDYAWNILEAVRQTESSGKYFSKWHIVYDQKNLVIYIKTLSKDEKAFVDVKTIALKDIDFGCAGKTKYSLQAEVFELNREGNEITGDISDRFVELEPTHIERSIDEVVKAMGLDKKKNADKKIAKFKSQLLPLSITPRICPETNR